MLKPLNNTCLIEVLDENEGIYSGSSEQNVQKGVLRDFTLIANHLTASAGYFIDDIQGIAKLLTKFKGKVVYWQEYADSGSKFDIGGKQYVLVPFYRLIGYEDA